MSRLELEYTDKWSFVYIEIYYKNIPININIYGLPLRAIIDWNFHEGQDFSKHSLKRWSFPDKSNITFLQ